MTAIRVLQPSGSNGELQFYDSNEFGADARLVYDQAGQLLKITGSLEATRG